MDILEQLLLEKRIDQITSKIDVIFSFDVIKTTHSEERQDFDKRGLNVDTLGYIPNKEMSEFVSYFKQDIAEKITFGEIVDQQNFVIRSDDKQLSMAIVAEQVEGNYWKLIIKTVFRETSDNRLRVGSNQLILEK